MQVPKKICVLSDSQPSPNGADGISIRVHVLFFCGGAE